MVKNTKKLKLRAFSNVTIDTKNDKNAATKNATKALANEFYKKLENTKSSQERMMPLTEYISDM